MIRLHNIDFWRKMNFSGISNKSLFGQALRLPLKLLPLQMKMPIMRGRLKGKKWVVGASNHGCWLGTYEYDKQNLFEKTVTSGSVVYDLGGHVGFYTLLASELVGPTGKVFVFEPLPRNLYYLYQHLQLNNITNVAVIEVAVSDKNGIMKFHVGSESSAGHLEMNGELEVKTIALDELNSKGTLPLPDFMKIDIEGAEYFALRGAEDILKKSHPIIFLATHGSTVHQQCCKFLSSIGYELKAIDGRELTQTDEILAIYSEG